MTKNEIIEKIKDRTAGCKTYTNMMDEIGDYIMENFVIPMEIRQEGDQDGH